MSYEMLLAACPLALIVFHGICAVLREWRMTPEERRARDEADRRADPDNEAGRW